MPDRSSPFVHLARGFEELLRGAADVFGTLRERAEQRAAEPPSAIERVLRGLADEASTWLARGEVEALRSLRAALRRELMRWDARADGDPAALRVRDLIEALLDALGDEAEEAPETERPPAHRKPRSRRSVAAD
jgi:plasmid stabilization system protein ParE